MPRIARIVLAGHPHHVLQRGNNRQAIFFDEADRSFYLALLRKYSKECDCKIKAYCLMDNHVHFLLVPGRNDSLAKTMQKLSLTFTQYINKKHRRTGRLWECRFHSSVVDTEAYLWTVCRYIERNPVRAGKVKRPIDYSWSSVKANTSGDCHDGIVEPIWKDYFDKDEYINFLNRHEEEKQIEEIKQSTIRGMPVGGENFIKDIIKNFGFRIFKKARGRPKKINGMCP
ncbi:MAG: transposase [Candidatus Omnitrophica bacterium CG11_big_fil_rev_8_21_14_0_20_42_13]|uniref:Transposase n=1 Tax=Candidatus Ghiorseimicrobium undicola TaxID=1974746 RepID=A0A2H0LZV0_9BACT|nr:MAG: transposase [Candidatus Omnitrophica bacterium CG11_big_fil_rev_8_21_14_0_20_42_13]